MKTEERMNAVVAYVRNALDGVQGKRPAPDESVWDARWVGYEVYGTFYPIFGGMPTETTPLVAPSVLVMPTAGKDEVHGESLTLRMLVTIYEPGDRVLPEEEKTGAIKELSDAGAGWRAVMLPIDKLREAFREGWRIPGSGLTIRSMTWSLFTEDALVPDFRPMYCAWLVLECDAGHPVRISDDVKALLD